MTNKYFRSFDVLTDLHRLPCMSIEYCVEPPSIGTTSNVTSSSEDPNESWMINKAEYKCTFPGKPIFRRSKTFLLV